jgi:hypothetical protein
VPQDHKEIKAALESLDLQVQQALKEYKGVLALLASPELLVRRVILDRLALLVLQGQLDHKEIKVLQELLE